METIQTTALIKLDFPLNSFYNIGVIRIKDKFTRSKFNHELVKREGNVAIFKRWGVGSKDHHYEVVKISKHNGYMMGGAYIEAAETYPGASLWGIQGWTCTDLEIAEKRYRKARIRFTKEVVYA